MSYALPPQKSQVRSNHLRIRPRLNISLTHQVDGSVVAGSVASVQHLAWNLSLIRGLVTQQVHNSLTTGVIEVFPSKVIVE